ncbi:undecaprenyldiphospho-muramoylpentapeptide beta-N-acetylglucosaminyltransferase [Prochlorothrix hollandica]|uniref:undecaprenyldiphospho-muramoylpentapeptide beta-N-acetylglucosaminyltransferase n=1 Tax=Prochlorothrix hollandica TaxID=1223 RepID=UPI003340F221
MTAAPPHLLIAASGTGGHLFPALAVAAELDDCTIEWLGVPDRLETQLVGDRYRLHTVPVTGFQGGLGLGSLKVLWGLIRAIFQVRRLLRRGRFQGVFTTGGYIAGPAILAARSLGLPVLLHESNALPGKVTRWFSPWCTEVALGVDSARRYLPKQAHTTYGGTPVRPDFLATPPPVLTLPIPAKAPLLVVMGGSQGAVALNQLVRRCAPMWLEAGIWIVHLTGEVDADRDSFHHDHYVSLPFYPEMAALLHRADLAISRAGAGTLTELAITHTPSILIPYPHAAEDHQTYNGTIFATAGAALLMQQDEVVPEELQQKVLMLLKGVIQRHQEPTHLPFTPNDPLVIMAEKTAELAFPDSARHLADRLRQLLAESPLNDGSLTTGP